MNQILGKILCEHQTTAKKKNKTGIQISPPGSGRVNRSERVWIKERKKEQPPQLSSDILTPRSTEACQWSQCLKIQRGLAAVETLPA